MKVGDENMKTTHYPILARNRQSAINKFKKTETGLNKKNIIVGVRKGVISGTKKYGMIHYEIEYRRMK